MLDASHYPSIGQAFKAVPPGGTLYIPEGEYELPPGGLLIDKAVQLLGDGPSTLLRVAANAPGIRIRSGLAAVRIADLQIQSGRSDPKHGIETIPVRNSKHVYLRFERVGVAGCGGDGFHLEGFDPGDGSIVHLTMTDCSADENAGRGAYLRNAAVARIEGGSYRSNGRHGIFADVCSAVRIWGPGLAGNQRRGTDPVYDTQLRIKLCHGFTVQGLEVSDFAPNDVCRTAVCLEACLAGSMRAGSIGIAERVEGARGIVAVGSRALAIGSIHTTNLEVFIESIRSSDVQVGAQAAQGVEGKVLGIPESR